VTSDCINEIEKQRKETRKNSQLKPGKRRRRNLEMLEKR
jgi:hypothetical protein